MRINSRIRRIRIAVLTSVSMTMVLSSSVSGRDPNRPVLEPVQSATARPAYCVARHDINQMVFGVCNNGTIGTWASRVGSQDCFAGDFVPHGEYPKASGTMYLAGGAIWVGAIVGRDTLVSVGADPYLSNGEIHPDESPLGDMILRSTIDPTKPEFAGAISEQDYIAVYTDTFTTGVIDAGTDYLTGRPHTPLFVEITQRSFAWSYSYAEDFVLFDLAIKNIGQYRLKEVYIGLLMDQDCCEAVLHGAGGQGDDISGFLDQVNADYLPQSCPDQESVNLAWSADNDGDFLLSPGLRVVDVTGMRVLRTPADSPKISFNWWVGNDISRDYGPQMRDRFRDLQTGGTGTPLGDRSLYHFLSNGEHDFDQIYTATIPSWDEIWVQPNQLVAADAADGYDTRYLLSCGPFGIDPGQSLPLSFAYVGGMNLHVDPENGANLPFNPEEYYKNLDFSDLARNSIWAEWIYDNPGVDTDSDGYAGVVYPCTIVGGDNPIIREIARRGDKVPDFRGASPPPAPFLWVEPRLESIHVRWNGQLSETTPDYFTGVIDFEGYRVYIGRDDRRSSLSVLQSYDQDNYQKWVWDDSLQVGDRLGGFTLKDSPFTLEALRCLYAPAGCDDLSWHPLDYTRSNFFAFSSGEVDSAFYFVKQDFNRSVLANYPDSANTDIRKRDPDAIRPLPEWIRDTTLIPDSLRDRVLTEDGYFLFYEYEYVIEDLLPTVPYWINVTTFDYGSPHYGLASLETSPVINPAVSYAHESVPLDTDDGGLQVYVYPNPYRADGHYRLSGYEGRGPGERDRPDDRVRRIHFANLPPECTIRIYSIDGDLVRELDHDVDPSDPLASHETWDLITRNTQLVVSGLYYWVIEAADGRTQIGKVAIIL
ncbi:MAG: hypothetical protein JSU65_01590 [Candidatus Zixiibacteriota bacterium]|nr:MAG: hypothetical protein JSU65_01590 [candidate division Zixibacteria bacterium]